MLQIEWQGLVLIQVSHCSHTPLTLSCEGKGRQQCNVIILYARCSLAGQPLRRLMHMQMWMQGMCMGYVLWRALDVIWAEPLFIACSDSLGNAYKILYYITRNYLVAISQRYYRPVLTSKSVVQETMAKAGYSIHAGTRLVAKFKVKDTVANGIFSLFSYSWFEKCCITKLQSDNSCSSSTSVEVRDTWI